MDKGLVTTQWQDYICTCSFKWMIEEIPTINESSHVCLGWTGLEHKRLCMGGKGGGKGEGEGEVLPNSPNSSTPKAA